MESRRFQRKMPSVLIPWKGKHAPDNVLFSSHRCRLTRPQPSHLNATEDDILEAKELAASMSLEHVRRVSHGHERGIFKLSSDIVE